MSKEYPGLFQEERLIADVENVKPHRFEFAYDVMGDHSIIKRLIYQPNQIKMPYSEDIVFTTYKLRRVPSIDTLQNTQLLHSMADIIEFLDTHASQYCNTTEKVFSIQGATSEEMMQNFEIYPPVSIQDFLPFHETYEELKAWDFILKSMVEGEMCWVIVDRALVLNADDLRVPLTEEKIVVQITLMKIDSLYDLSSDSNALILFREKVSPRNTITLSENDFVQLKFTLCDVDGNTVFNLSDYEPPYIEVEVGESILPLGLELALRRLGENSAGNLAIASSLLKLTHSREDAVFCETAVATRDATHADFLRTCGQLQKLHNFIVFMDLNIIHVTRLKRPWQLNVEEKLAIASSFHEKGNNWYYKLNPHMAAKRWDLAQTYLDDLGADAQHEDLLAAKAVEKKVILNLSKAAFDLEDYELSIKRANQVIKEDSYNEKALHRKCCALLKKGEIYNAYRVAEMGRDFGSADTKALFISKIKSIRMEMKDRDKRLLG